MRACGCNGDRGRHRRGCRLGLYKPPTTHDRLLKSEASARQTRKRQVRPTPPLVVHPHCGVCPLPIGHLCPNASGKLGRLVW